MDIPRIGNLVTSHIKLWTVYNEKVGIGLQYVWMSLYHSACDIMCILKKWTKANK